jgi:hypothetical protein
MVVALPKGPCRPCQLFCSYASKVFNKFSGDLTNRGQRAGSRFHRYLQALQRLFVFVYVGGLILLVLPSAFLNYPVAINTPIGTNHTINGTINMTSNHLEFVCEMRIVNLFHALFIIFWACCLLGPFGLIIFLAIGAIWIFFGLAMLQSLATYPCSSVLYSFFQVVILLSVGAVIALSVLAVLEYASDKYFKGFELRMIRARHARSVRSEQAKARRMLYRPSISPFRSGSGVASSASAAIENEVDDCQKETIVDFSKENTTVDDQVSSRTSWIISAKVPGTDKSTSSSDTDNCLSLV